MVNTAWRKITSSAMALVLAAGLCPAPAMADAQLQSANPAPIASAPAAQSVTDPTQIESAHDPYGDNVELAWTYTYGGAADGLAITFDEHSRTSWGDFITIKYGDDGEIANIFGDLRNQVIYVPSGNSFTLEFTTDDDFSDMYGFKVASVEPMTEHDKDMVALTDEAKSSLFSEANVTIDGNAAADYESSSYEYDADDPTLPKVAISDGTNTLVEGRDFIVSYRYDDDDIDAIDGVGDYIFTIQGTGAFRYRSIGQYHADEDYTDTRYYPFTLYTGAEDTKAAIQELTPPVLEGIDDAYPDAASKRDAIEAFKGALSEITRSVDAMGDEAQTLLGESAYAKYQEAVDVSNSLVSLESDDTPIFIWLENPLDESTPYEARYIADGNPVQCNPTLKLESCDEENGEMVYEVIDPANYTLVYTNAATDEVSTEPPSEPGNYTVTATGLNNYYGTTNGSIQVIPSLTYAHVDGDTLTLTTTDYGENSYANAEQVEWNDDAEAAVPQWYEHAAEIKHVTTDPGTTPYSLSGMFVGFVNLETVDFSNLDATYLPELSDSDLFAYCTSLKSIVFGTSYKPGWAFGIEGGWVNPLDPDDVWDNYSLGSNLLPEMTSTWRYDDETQTWSIDQTDVEIPATYNESPTFDGTIHTAYSDADGYTFSGEAEATDAGSHTAIATLDNHYITRWTDGTHAPKQYTWSIAKKNATVTPNAASKVEGQSDPTFTATTDGTLGEDTLTYTLSRQPGEEPGTYTITASGASDQGNYNVSFGTAEFTIEPKPPVVEKTKVDVPQGGAYVFDGTSKTGVNNGDAYTLSGTTEAVAAGDYTATATLKDPETTEWSDGSDEAKAISWSISRKPVTVTPNAASKTEGEKDPAFTASVNGTLGSDTVAYKLSRNAGEAAGTYTITAKGEKAQGNYEVTFGTAAFKINAKPTVATPTVTKLAIPVAKSYTYDGKTKTGVAAGKGYTLSGTTAAKNAGKYTAVAKLADKSKYSWSDGTTADKKLTWSIAKAKNSKFKAVAKSKTLTAKYGKKTTVKASKAFKISNANGGKVTYAKASGDKKITVAKNGTITVKKGLKKKTYTVKVKVKAAASTNYKASATKTVTLKVKVK